VTATVRALATTPVKGLRVVGASRLELGPSGAPNDRRFHLVDDRGRMFNGKRTGVLNTVAATYDAAARELGMTFDGGEVVTGVAELGEEIDTTFYSQPLRARIVQGPWSQALSALAGQSLRLVACVDGSALDRGRRGAVSLVSSASVAELARAAGGEDVQPRRFRMLVEIEGVAAHEEDGWVGSAVQIGAALVRMRGHVGRCVVTTRHPDSGDADLPMLDLLRSYRGDLDTTEPLAFGIYGEVLEGGAVAVGDDVRLA
jgi:uncharacterized protein YcbX